MNLTHAILGGAFLGYAGLSLTWTSGDPVWGLAWIASLTFAWIVGSVVNDPRRGWLCLCYTALVPTAFAFAFGINPNYIGCGLVLLLAAAFTYHWYWLAGVIGAALLTTQSRGAILAGLGVGALAAGRRFPVCTFGVVVVGGLAALSMKSDLGTSFGFRLGVWQDTLNAMVPGGHGIGSFATEYAKLSRWTIPAGALPPHAYNDFLQALFEYGIGAVPLVILIVLAFDSHLDGRLIIAGVLLSGLTFFPLQIPLIAHAFAFTLGHLSRSPYAQIVPRAA